MAVFQQELKWSTYQDKQLKVLESLEKSFNSSLQISVNIGKSLTSIATAVDAIARSATKNFSNSMSQSSRIILESSGRAAKSLDSQADALNNVTSVLEDHKKILNQHGETIVNVTEKMQEEIKAAEDKKKKEEDLLREQAAAQKQIISEVIRIVGELGKSADRYSEISNTFIRTTGLSGEDVRTMRGTIVHDIVKQLNKETGKFYNAKEVYAQMAAVSNQVGIGSSETIEEITRPTMLAQESMNVNIGSIAKLLGKWHTRYEFSSIYMEELVNDIRSSTAGNQATAEATLENLAFIESQMVHYARGDEDKILAMSKDLSEFTAYQESMGIDSSRYIQYFKDIMDGTITPELVALLGEAGIDFMEAQKMLSEVDGYSKLGLEIQNAEYSRGKKWIEAPGENILGLIAPEYGADKDAIQDVYNAMEYGNMKSYEEFRANMDDRTAVEAVEDQYVSFLDKIKNQLSGMTEYLASIQEKMGIGLSDIASIAGGWILLKGLLNTLKQAFPTLLPTLKEAGKSLLSKGSSLLSKAPKLESFLNSTGKVASNAARATGKFFSNPANVSTVAKGAGLAGVIASLAMIPSSGVNYTGIWKSDLVKGAEEGLTGDDLHEYMLENTQIGVSNLTSDPKTGKPLTTEERRKLAEEDFNYWYESTMSSAEAAVSEDFYRGMISALEERVSSGEKLDERFIRSTAASFGVDNITQETLALLMNNMYGNGSDYKTPWIYGGSIADASISKFIKKNLGNSNEWDPDSAAMAVRGYAIGSNYIDKDQLALLHEGEAVVPKKYNPSANLTELEMLREQAKKHQQDNSQEAKQSQTVLKATLDTLVEIKDFLSQWQEDNIRREQVTESRNRFGFLSQQVAGYLGGER